MTEPTQKYYYPQLDAIRGLSFLAVFFFHSYHPDFGKGIINEGFQFFYSCLDYSIDVFFVLSSFLLTWLGINEFANKGNFSFRKYFLRRALRIWPLYYLLMAFSFIVVPAAAHYTNTPVTLPPAPWYLFFVSNFYTPGHVYFLRFLWTLSVEEQFYLVLGVCLLFMQKRLKAVAFILLGISLLYNIYAVIKDESFYFNTLTYLFDFAVGSLAALALKKNGFIVRVFSKGGIKASLWLYISLPVMLVLEFIIQRNTTGVAQDLAGLSTRLIFILLIAFLIIEQLVNKAAPLKFGKSRALIYTGKISYGLYCFHGIVLTFGAIILQKLNITMHPVLMALLFLAVNYMIASVSYYVIEKPFLRLKDRLKRV